MDRLADAWSTFLLWVHDPLIARVLRVMFGFVLLWIGIRVGRWTARIEHRVLMRAHVDLILAEFLRNLTYALVLILFIVSALDFSGFPTKTLLTVLGTAGIAIGLALKDSVAHIAAGVVLIVLRPFRVGDAVNIASQEGIVEGVFIFTTRLHTYDNRDVVLMNGAVIAGPIINYSERPQRRSDMTLWLVPSADLAGALQAAKDEVAADPRIATDPAPYIAIGDITERGAALLVQVWTVPADMGLARSDLLVRLQRNLTERGIPLAQIAPAVPKA